MDFQCQKLRRKWTNFLHVFWRVVVQIYIDMDIIFQMFFFTVFCWNFRPLAVLFMFQELYNVALENVQRAATCSAEERQRCGQRLAVISKVIPQTVTQRLKLQSTIYNLLQGLVRVLMNETPTIECNKKF